MVSGSLLFCSLCGEVCRLAVTLPCCDLLSQACRGCAVVAVTGLRACWECGKTGYTATSLVNDRSLRAAAEHFTQHGVMDPSHCKVLSGSLTWIKNAKLERCPDGRKVVNRDPIPDLGQWNG